MVHQHTSRGFVVFADAWLSGWLAEISANLRENGSALEVVLHDYALYKSTFTLLYFILQVNYPILLQTGTGGPCRNYVGQEVKGQGHRRPK